MAQRKIPLLILILIVVSTGIFAKKKTLRFNQNGVFKIVQFTDTHYYFDSPKSAVVIEMMNEVLDAEKPDLVIFTGDVVTLAPLEKGWRAITEPIVKRQISWAVTLGNHDDEQDQKREAILPLIKDIPYNVTLEGDKKVYGHGNYVLPIQSQLANKTVALLYCMDSNAYTSIEGVGKYGWFRRSQIDWYSQTSSRWTKKNGGTPLPALAFFHIPLPEYTQAWEKGDLEPIGVKNEEVCSPVVNTGMFATMLQQGDVMGTFVGHDHVNDYVAALHGIALTYGRFSGGASTYGDLTNGARVIVLEEGKRQFTTWIRVRGGEKINEVTY